MRGSGTRVPGNTETDSAIFICRMLEH